MSDLMSGAEIVRALKDARAQVARGWIQGTGTDMNGNVCAIHALASALVDDSQATYALRVDTLGTVLLGAVMERTGEPWSCVPDWNDDPDRTQDEVLDTFDYAIKTVERDWTDE